MGIPPLDMPSVDEFLRRDSLDNILKSEEKATCVSRNSMNWYHGAINRRMAELKLKKGSDGSFMVRKSPMSPADFVLSVLYQGKASHYKIHSSSQTSYALEDGPSKKGLDQLISYYKGGAHGLACILRNPIKGQLPPIESVSSTVNNFLHRSAMEGNTRVALQVLHHKRCPEINARNALGSCALHIACEQNLVDLASQLIDRGAKINLIDYDGHSPLQLAAMHGHAKLIHLLLSHNADPLQRYKPTGAVALHEAASRGYSQAVQAFLVYHVAVWPRDNDLQTPYQLARSKGHITCAKILNSYLPPPADTHRSFWLHNDLDRSRAVERLQEQGSSDGLFLVRPSSQKPNYFVLCLTFKSYPYNFEIIEKERVFYISDGPLLTSLEHLIEYYSKHADGLPCRLQNAVSADGYIYPMHDESSVSAKSEQSGWVFVESNTPVDSNLNQVSQPGQSPGVSSATNAVAVPNLARKNCKKVQRRGTLKQSFSKLPVPVEPMKIDRGSISIEYEIGQGEFGSVLRGVWYTKGTQIPVALKTLAEGCPLDSFMHEAKIMVKLDHPCIVKLIGICEGPPLLLIQELVELGSLQDYLQDYPERINVHTDLYLWATQVASGMTYLETQGYVHRDLATRNILLAGKHQAKVGDFGLSRAMDTTDNSYQASSGGKWPIRWYALESVLYGKFSSASDVWSFGVSLWEMFSFAQQPYSDKSGPEVVAYLQEGQRLEKPENCTDRMYDLMMECWCDQPEKRPRFRKLYMEILNDPDFEGQHRFRIPDPDFEHFIYGDSVC